MIAVALGVGVLVTRLIEAAGRPAHGEAGSTGTTWLNRQQGSWANQLPARSTDPTWVDASDERWGAR